MILTQLFINQIYSFEFDQGVCLEKIKLVLAVNICVDFLV